MKQIKSRIFQLQPTVFYQLEQHCGLNHCIKLGVVSCYVSNCNLSSPPQPPPTKLIQMGISSCCCNSQKPASVTKPRFQINTGFQKSIRNSCISIQSSGISRIEIAFILKSKVFLLQSKFKSSKFLWNPTSHKIKWLETRKTGGKSLGTQTNELYVVEGP